MRTVNDLLWSLLIIPSVSGNEKDIADYIVSILTKEAFTIQKIQVTENTYCIKATIGMPQVYLSSHMDTMPGGKKPEETNTQFIGRGACDTKGSLASMISAAILGKRNGIKNIGLLFTVEEETSFKGAKQIMECIKTIPFVVVGEPTSLSMVTSQFGFLEIEILAKGKTAHTSNPKEGVNAIDTLLAWKNNVNPLRTSFDTVSTLCKISGGTAGNMIPDQASMTISFRVDTKDKTSYINNLIKITKQKNISIRNVCEISSVQTHIPKQLEWLKNRTSIKYASELSIYKNGIIFGPGDIAYAHSDNEYINKKEVEKAVNLYLKIIKSFN